MAKLKKIFLMEIDVSGIMKAIRHTKLLLIGLILLIGKGYGVSQNLSDTIEKAWQLCHAEKFTEAATLLEEISDSCLNAHDTLLLPFVYVNSYAQEKIGNYEKCIVYTLKEIELRQKYRIREEKYFFLFERLGNAFEKMGDLDNAEKYYRKGLLKTLTLLSDTNELQKWKASDVRNYRSLMYRELGNLYASKGDTALAKACYAQRRNDLFDQKTKDWIMDEHEKAISMRKSGQYKDAVDVYDKMLFRISKIDMLNEEYIDILYGKGLVLSWNLRRFGEAALIFSEIIDISKMIPYSIEDVWYSYCNYVKCAAWLGDFYSVEMIIPQAIAYIEQLPHETAPIPYSIYRYGGNGAYESAHYTEAISYYEKYLSYKRESGNHFLEIANLLSICYIQQGVPLKAKTYLMSILQQEESLFDANNKALLAEVYYGLGVATMLIGEYAEAIRYLWYSADVQRKVYGNPSAQTIEYLKKCQKYIR